MFTRFSSPVCIFKTQLWNFFVYYDIKGYLDIDWNDTMLFDFLRSRKKYHLFYILYNPCIIIYNLRMNIFIVNIYSLLNASLNSQLTYMLHCFLSCRDSSVGRALDWRSKGPRFDPGSRHLFSIILLMKHFEFLYN